MKDKSYHIQDGCHNCNFVFRFLEYDEGSQYFCHNDKSNRPKCGSVLMAGECTLFEVSKGDSEQDYEDNTQNSLKKMELWYEWSKDRHVSESGKCKFWKLKEPVQLKELSEVLKQSKDKSDEKL